MLLSTIEVIPGTRISKHLGIVQGSTVRAKHVGRDMMASLKNIFGGELRGYTELLEESRQEALDRLTEQAKAKGANAVLNIRFSTATITAGASEILAYGTAVVLVKPASTAASATASSSATTASTATPPANSASES